MHTSRYTITEGSLVLLHHGVQSEAWPIPDGGGVSIASVSVDMLGGDSWCDVIRLSDGRVILVSDDSETVELYASADDAVNCANGETLDPETVTDDDERSNGPRR